MKTLALVFAMFVLCCGVSYANTLEATVDTYAGWTLMAAPLVPVDSSPLSVFDGYDLELQFNSVIRWDAPTARMWDWNPWETPPGVSFGNILLGDGYWLQDNAPLGGQAKYVGVTDGVPDSTGGMTDMWISLPGGQIDSQDKGGWHLIGQPFFHDTPVDDGSLTGAYIKFTDGVRTLSWDEASSPPYDWIDTSFSYWEGTSQRMLDCGFSYRDDDHFRYGHGYWFQTKKDNLTMIIPAYPAENQPYP